MYIVHEHKAANCSVREFYGGLIILSSLANSTAANSSDSHKDDWGKGPKFQLISVGKGFIIGRPIYLNDVSAEMAQRGW